jgi:hypothetical protein
MKTARWLKFTALAVILASFCLQAVLTIPRLSATTDEAVHLTAGYSYWKTLDFRMNPEHPPLAKLIAAMPLLVLGPKFEASGPDWETDAQYPFGYKFLYQNDADRLLFWSRLIMTGLAATGLLVTFLWARDMFGDIAGLFAAGMYAFSPNLLAHGILVTTDVPLAVFTVLTLYLFWKGRDLYTGLAIGAAMACKFSGAFLPIVVTILCLARDRRHGGRRLIIIGAAALAVIEASFLFSESPLQYFRNATWVNVKRQANYPYYLFGELKLGGWWYYFPVAFVLKATIPTLLLIIAAGVEAVRGWINRWGEGILAAAIAVYMIVITIGAVPIGFRYLLPILPLIFVWTSRIVPRLATTRSGIGILVVLLIWQASASIRSFPNYIPYFNELAGGAAAGPAFLDDSNIDWGQGVKQAAEYVRANHLENVRLYTFSPFDNPPFYGLPPNIPPEQAFQQLVARRPAPGVYIISAHYVARMKTVSPAWREFKPVDRIGESLLVYAF